MNFVTALAYLFCPVLPCSCLAMFCKPFFSTLYITLSIDVRPRNIMVFGPLGLSRPHLESGAVKSDGMSSLMADRSVDRITNQDDIALVTNYTPR